MVQPLECGAPSNAGNLPGGGTVERQRWMLYCATLADSQQGRIQSNASLGGVSQTPAAQPL